MNTPQNDETTTVAACPPLSGGLGGSDKLPEGKTCIQCVNYDHGLMCHWKLGVYCGNTICQWSESRFMTPN